MQHIMLKRFLPFGVTLFVGLVVGNVFAFFAPRTLPAPPTMNPYYGQSGTGYGGGGYGQGGGGCPNRRSNNLQFAVEGTRRAEINFKPSPAYTSEARRNMTTGTVRLRAVLTDDGRVENIYALQRLPDGLTEQAIQAARRLEFAPALKDGRAVSQSVTLEYNFNLY